MFRLKEAETTHFYERYRNLGSTQVLRERGGVGRSHYFTGADPAILSVWLTLTQSASSKTTRSLVSALLNLSRWFLPFFQPWTNLCQAWKVCRIVHGYTITGQCLHVQSKKGFKGTEFQQGEKEHEK